MVIKRFFLTLTSFSGFFTVFALVLFPAYAALNVNDQALNDCIKSTMEKKELSDYRQLKILKCHNKGIISLSGLEALIGLENLSLFGNKIERANLQALTNLKFLNLAKNNLQELEIVGLSKLETLHVFKNKLTTINFEGLTALSKMRLMQNQLRKLDITPLRNLQEAFLWDNSLEDLQITGLDALEFLDVKQNPMPDDLYDFYDEQEGITISHDGNADDWK